MSDEQVVKSESDGLPTNTELSVEGEKATARPVGAVGVVLLTLYLIGLSILAVFGLIQFLPEKVLAGSQPANSSAVCFMFWTFSVSPEMRLFITVALAGLLGSLVHALRSLYWYLGNRAFVRSWIPKYILMPIIGTVLGLAFYLIIRGGFFSGGANVDQTNPYGFMALGVLIGMFSEQAVLKLKEVAETLFSKPPAGADARPQGKPDSTPEPGGDMQ